MTATLDAAPTGQAARLGSTLRVTGVEQVGPDAVTVTFAAAAGGRLPDWAPGAHIDLHLPDGLTRQYSLCGDRWDARQYRVGVKHEPYSRGGSSYLHSQLKVGDRIDFGGPRNNFCLYPADRYLFIAGGIGVTPLLPMIDQAERMGLPWQCLALCKTRDRMPFNEELARMGPGVTFVESAGTGRCDLQREVRERLDGGTAVYACGPETLLDELSTMEPDLDLPPAGLRLERFAASPSEDEAAEESFEIALSRTGGVVHVDREQSALDALRGRGMRILASCERGLCGTCEAGVLDGAPDHRDSVLSEHERDRGDCMMLCVSRARTPRITLDL